MKHILHTNFGNYIKPPGFIAVFRELFADSLFALNHAHCPDNGAKWRLQRKIAAKVFTTNNFKFFMEQAFVKNAEEMVALVAHEQDGRCDMQHVAKLFTLQSIFNVTMGVPLAQVANVEDFGESIEFTNEQAAARLFVKQHYKWFGWCMPSEQRLKREVAAIHQVTGRILQQRMQESDEELAARSDILSLFLKKQRELSEDEASLFDTDALQKLLQTFLFGGRDTTASCITYAFYALCQNPDAHRKAVDEIMDYTSKASLSSSSASLLSYDGIKSLKYLDAVVHETLRLYPPAPYSIKRAVEDDHLPDGTFVPAGCDVAFSAWYLGRNSAMWMPDPLAFRPERWLEMDERKMRPTAYEFPVFQAGPRICPGMNMAVLEAKIFLAVMLQRFESVVIEKGESQERTYVLKTTLTMDGGLPLQMVLREAQVVAA